MRANSRRVKGNIRSLCVYCGAILRMSKLCSHGRASCEGRLVTSLPQSTVWPPNARLSMFDRCRSLPQPGRFAAIVRLGQPAAHASRAREGQPAASGRSSTLGRPYRRDGRSRRPAPPLRPRRCVATRVRPHGRVSGDGRLVTSPPQSIVWPPNAPLSAFNGVGLCRSEDASRRSSDHRSQPRRH